MPGRPPPFRVSHVFFDVDGTLVDFAAAQDAGLRAASEAILTLTGRVVTPAELTMERNRIARGMPLVPGSFVVAREESFRQFIALAANVDVEAGVREVSRAFFEAREAAMQPYEDVEDTVRALRERGVQLVAATNGNATMVSLPVFQQMHLLFTAEDYGVAKPDARFFLEAMARSGARPETSLMVGDRMDNDILPALRLGMYGALLDRDGGAPDVDVPRLDSLTDLLSLIEVVPTAS